MTKKTTGLTAGRYKIFVREDLTFFVDKATTLVDDALFALEVAEGFGTTHTVAYYSNAEGAWVLVYRPAGEEPVVWSTFSGGYIDGTFRHAQTFTDDTNVQVEVLSTTDDLAWEATYQVYDVGVGLFIIGENDDFELAVASLDYDGAVKGSVSVTDLTLDNATVVVTGTSILVCGEVAGNAMLLRLDPDTCQPLLEPAGTPVANFLETLTPINDEYALGAVEETYIGVANLTDLTLTEITDSGFYSTTFLDSIDSFLLADGNVAIVGNPWSSNGFVEVINLDDPSTVIWSHSLPTDFGITDSNLYWIDVDGANGWLMCLTRAANVFTFHKIDLTDGTRTTIDMGELTIDFNLYPMYSAFHKLFLMPYEDSGDNSAAAVVVDVEAGTATDATAITALAGLKDEIRSTSSYTYFVDEEGKFFLLEFDAPLIIG